MTWCSTSLNRLSQEIPCGYHEPGEASTEPTAIATLALALSGQPSSARSGCQWINKYQQSDGAVGISPVQASPKWCTSLALLAWTVHDEISGDNDFSDCRERAVSWALTNEGKVSERMPEIGHDSSLRGWSWAANTHAWIEPTAFFLLALRKAGYAKHPRCQEAEQLLVDRLLPEGGCNYGNTFVLGQQLLPHIQPTGIALLALAGSECGDQRIDRSCDYLEKTVTRDTAVASLAFALLGLKAQGRAHPKEGGATRKCLLSGVIATRPTLPTQSPYTRKPRHQLHLLSLPRHHQPGLNAMNDQFNRRDLLTASGLVAAGYLATHWIRDYSVASAPVFLANNQHYDRGLTETIRAGNSSV